MLNVFLGFPCVPLGQVSLSWPLPPLAHLYISIHFAPNLFPFVSLSLYTHVHSPATFLHPPSLPFLFHTNLIPLSPISLFWYFLWLFFCYQHYPTPPYPCLAHPIPLPLPGPPTSHFAFLILSMAIPMLSEPFPTLIYSLALFSRVPLPLPGPSHPLLPPTPPHSPFRFFGSFMNAFLCTFISYSIYMCIYMICSIELRTFDRFFGAISCQGKGNVLLSTVGNRPLKSIQIFMHALWCMVNVSHTAEREWGGPVVAYCNPQLTAEEAA